MCVPLINKEGQAAGVIYVDNPYREGVFTNRELNLLTAFGNQVSIAIANSLLFQQVQDSLNETTRLKELIENIFASIDSAIITTDAEDRVQTMNRAASEILVRPPEAALNLQVHDLLTGVPELDENVRKVRAQGQSLVLEATARVPERGPVILGLRMSPLKDGEQRTQGVAIIADDLTAAREREQMLNMAGRYLPPGMIDNIEAIAALERGGQRREMTCAFIYSCPYTLFPSDRPREMMDRLNIYLTVATQSIYRAGGVIDKYMGNEIMVLFNSQLNPQDDHAARALQMALDMRQAFAELYAREGMDPNRHYYRIGVHTGVATMGNVGSANRRNFTALGDTINLAKRLQENAVDGQIILSEDTMRHAERTPGLRFTPRGTIQVKGLTKLISVYDLE
jgi:class 3 adenylate cyclase